MLQPAALSRRRQLVLADLLPGTVARDVLLVVVAAGLVGLSAQVSFHLPFTPVPVTGQTFGVLIVGTALGWRRALAALALYAVAGLAGVPWFAAGSAGYVGATFGYVAGFVPAAALVGALAGRGADRHPLRMLATMVAGEAAIYAVGVPWLAVSLHVGLARGIVLGMLPFLPGDALKALAAAGLLPSAWKLLGRSGPGKPEPAGSSPD
jgi:biotin transport system substrate-specific component